MRKLTYNSYSILKWHLKNIMVSMFIFYCFLTPVLLGEEGQVPQKRNDQDYNQVYGIEPNQIKTSLNTTQEVFNNAFNDLGHNEIILRDLILKANDEEKNWIKEALINRFNSESNTKNRLICMNLMIGFREEAARFYVQALNDTDIRIRRSAAHILGSVGSEQDAEALLQAMKKANESNEQDTYLSLSIVGSLGQIGGKKAAEALLEIWNSDDLSKGCKTAILGMLGMTGDPNVFKMLEVGLRGNDEQIRDNAAYGLGELGRKNKGNKGLINNITQLLRKYIKDSNPSVRNNIANSLGIMGTREDIPLLKILLEDEFSTTVSFTENGVMKKRTIFPVREAAKKAIDNIEKRLSEK